MSQLDKELLSVAGLKAPDAAAVLRRSRQAIYQGLSDSRTYFSASEVIAFVSEVLRRDSPRMEALADFIERNYPDKCDIILPGRVACSQLEHAARGAEQIVVGFNGGVEHLAESALFAKAIAKVLGLQGNNVDVLACEDWARGYFENKLTPRPRRVIISSAYNHPLCFFMVVKKDNLRPFFVGRYSLGEGIRGNERGLWNYLRPILQ